MIFLIYLKMVNVKKKNKKKKGIPRVSGERGKKIIVTTLRPALVALLSPTATWTWHELAHLPKQAGYFCLFASPSR